MPLKKPSIYLPLLAGLFSSLVPSTGFACSTCMVGDPSLTVMGAEKPYENRLRFSLDYLNRDEDIGVAGTDLKTIDEDRLTLNIAWAPSKRWMLGISLPWIKKELNTVTLAQEEVNTPGDITLSVKTYLQDQDSFQSHMYGLMSSVRLPTAEEQKDNGELLDIDIQPGSGSTTVSLGAWYAYFKFPWLFYASSAYFVSDEGDQNFDPGDAWTLNLSSQYATDYKLAFQLALESRWSEKDQFNNADDENSGGLLSYIAPGIVYTLQEDLLFNAAIKFPIIEELDGNHEEGTIFTMGLTYDFNLH